MTFDVEYFRKRCMQLAEERKVRGVVIDPKPFELAMTKFPNGINRNNVFDFIEELRRQHFLAEEARH